jgi:hypothetical protein
LSDQLHAPAALSTRKESALPRDKRLGGPQNKNREYLKVKINELETNNKDKNIRDLYRGIKEFKKGYQPRINIIKYDNGNLLADP